VVPRRPGLPFLAEIPWQRLRDLRAPAQLMNPDALRGSNGVFTQLTSTVWYRNLSALPRPKA